MQRDDGGRTVRAMVGRRPCGMRVMPLCAISLSACGGISPATDAAPTDAPQLDASSPDAATCVASPPGLRAHWRAEMDTSDETTLYDGVASGGVTYAPGRHGDAFRFDGASGVVAADTGDKLYPSASFSVEAWVNTYSPNAVVVSKYDCGGAACSGSYWGLEIDVAGVVYFAFRIDGSQTNTLIARGPTVNDGDWHHVVGVRDVGRRQHLLYVDGTMVAANSIAGADLGPIADVDRESDPLTIGAGRTAGSNPNSSLLLGAIDEVAYYESALTADQVAAIFVARDGICP